jgi:hypothetical protein
MMATADFPLEQLYQTKFADMFNTLPREKHAIIDGKTTPIPLTNAKDGWLDYFSGLSEFDKVTRKIEPDNFDEQTVEQLRYNYFKFRKQVLILNADRENLSYDPAADKMPAIVDAWNTTKNTLFLERYYNPVTVKVGSDSETTRAFDTTNNRVLDTVRHSGSGSTGLNLKKFRVLDELIEANLMSGDAVDEFGTEAYMVVSQKDVHSLMDDLESRGKSALADRMVMGDKLIGYGRVRFCLIEPSRHPAATVGGNAVRRLPVWFPKHVGSIQEEMKWKYHLEARDLDDNDSITCRTKLDYIRLQEAGCYEILVSA